MPRKKTVGLTDAELRVMNVLWTLGEATVAEVKKALARHKLAYTTILTTIQILESKRYVGHRAGGRAYVFHPLVERAAMRQAALQKFLKTWFESSPQLLVTTLLEQNELDARELKNVLAAAAPRRKKK